MNYDMMGNAIEYNAGLYIRLSKEDLEKPEYKDSESVSNQRNLLLQYAEKNNIKVVDIYVDDGISGTSFDRPEFNRMIADIEKKRINMVITKDLSRLGRDYIMSGYYTEQYFPAHRVRYLALLDNIDTASDSSNNDIAPFKSVLNDMYAKDTSKKIRSILRNKKEMGLFVGKEAPYGYMKDPNNKYQLIIDETAAEIVREIYRRFLNGEGTTILANDLSMREIPIPSVHKNINRGNRGLGYGLWTNRTIKHILTYEVYTGCLVQNRFNKLNYKSKKTIETTPDKWIKVENTHEPIIDKETWDRVQELIKQKSGKRVSKNIYLLTGLMKCYDCKKTLSIAMKSEARGYAYARCPNYQKFSKFGICTSHSINYTRFEKQFVELIRDLFKEYTDVSKLKKIASSQKNNNAEKEVKEKISFYINMEEKCNRKLDQLYDDKFNDVISTDDYKRMSEKVKKERETYLELKKEYEQKLEELTGNKKSSDKEKLDKIVDEFLSMEYPTRDIIGRFVEKIEVHEDKQIDIYFKFQALNEMMQGKECKYESKYAG